MSPNKIKPEVSTDSANHEENLSGIGDIPFIGPIELLDADTALKCGVTGYLSIDVGSDTPKEIYASEGKADLMLTVKFVSFRSDIYEAEVTFGSTGPGVLTIEIPYGNRLLCLNDLVSYEPSGTLKVSVDRILQVKMIVKVPVGYPQVSFPLGAVGVTSNVLISDRINVTVHV